MKRWVAVHKFEIVNGGVSKTQPLDCSRRVTLCVAFGLRLVVVHFPAEQVAACSIVWQMLNQGRVDVNQRGVGYSPRLAAYFQTRADTAQLLDA